MKRMHRMPTRKPHSWWWDSHISPKNSKWLAENLEEMDKQVKEMLRLLEEEGESFAKKAEMYYQRRPLLVNHVENFYRMYRALAERYDNVTGELRKNIPSSLQSQRSSGISESDSETQSPSPSPEPDLEQKTPRQKRKPRPAGFDSLLGSGGSSDISKKGSDGSSSSSESDSEPDEAKEEDGNSISYALNQRIIELEDELHEATEKLEALEEKTMHCQCEFGANGNASVLNSKFSELEEKLQASRVEISELHKDLEERSQSSKSFAEVNSEKEALQAAVLANKNEIETLKGAMASASKQYESQLAHRDLEVEKCKQELEQVSEKYLCDKFTLEAEITKLQEVIKKFEGDLAKMSQEKLQLESRVKELEQATRSLDDSSAEIMKLKEVIKDLQEGLGNVSNEKEVLQEKIKNLEAEQESALKEKSLLEDRVKDLEQVTHELNASVTHSLEKFSLEKSSLSAEVLNLSEANASLEDKLALVEAQLKHVHAEKAEASRESEKQISELNQILANLNSKLELLSSEKAVVDNKVATLLTEITTRDEKMSQMESHLHQLHLEHAKLLAEIDMAQKAVSELRAQVHELEEEVEKQKLVISDSAEGKREAIRQLCFSLEHYRDGYQQLRQLLQCHRRPMVMAT